MRYCQKQWLGYKEKEGRGAMSEAVRQYAMEYAKRVCKGICQGYGEEQKEEGFFREKNNMLYSLVSKGRLKIDVAAEEANVSLENLKNRWRKQDIKF